MEKKRPTVGDANYELIIGKMLECKQTIISANETIKALEAIKADLESEVDEEDED